MSQLPVIFKREQLFRHAARLCVHRDLPGALRGIHLLPGRFYERGQADLTPFFSFHTWLYLFLVPAIAMRCGPRSASPVPSSC